MWTYSSSNGSLTKLTFPTSSTSYLSYTYDSLKRLSKRTLTTSNVLHSSKEYTYLAGSGTNATTTLVATLKNKNSSGTVTESYTYTYDSLGNISTVSGSSSESYTYDKHNKLKKAIVNGTTYTYTYDVSGNILSKSDGSTTDSYTYGKR